MKKKNFKETIKHNTINLPYWTLTRLISFAIAAFLPKMGLSNTKPWLIISIAVNTLLGLGMIIANIRFLKDQDDLQKKIQLEAIAIGLGVGVLGGLDYSLLTNTGILSGKADISVLVIIISITSDCCAIGKNDTQKNQLKVLQYRKILRKRN